VTKICEAVDKETCEVIKTDIADGYILSLGQPKFITSPGPTVVCQPAPERDA
jgi:hypothetical protein